MTAVLEQEFETYRANRVKMLGEHRGEFVLIKGTEIVGFYASREEALRAGYRRFGIVDLFVEVVADPEPYAVFSGIAVVR